MTRISLLALSCATILLNRNCCTLTDDGSCLYEEFPLSHDDPTPWGTIVSEDVEQVSAPQHGIWRWSESIDELDIADAGLELAAQAVFVPDPTTYRQIEHLGEQSVVACIGITVAMDGTFTFTDEQGEIIVSFPATVARDLSGVPQYYAQPTFSPVADFSTGLHENVEYGYSEVVASITWYDNERLLVEFGYRARTELSDTTASGIVYTIATFEADE